MVGGGFVDIYLISDFLKFGIYYQNGKKIKNLGFNDTICSSCIYDNTDMYYTVKI